MERIRFYWSGQLATHLNIGRSTLRKWALALEKTGYIFERDEHGNRAFLEHDAIALKAFKDCLTARMTIENAASFISEKYKREQGLQDIVPGALPVPTSTDERITKLEDKIDLLIDELRKHEAERDQAIERRDQAIMQLMHQMMETKQLQAATAEKKHNWFRFLKRNQ